MDVFDSINQRRSVRKYMDIPVPFESVGRICDAGAKAPSAGNLQDVKFIIVLDEGKRKALAEASLQQYWMSRAPVHIVVCVELSKCRRFYGIRGERLYAIQNAAAAVENMLLAANALDLAACWVGAFNEDQVKRACGIPDYARPQAIVTVGYADEKPLAPPKLKIENLVFLEKYQNRIRNVPLVLGEISPNTEAAVKGAKSKLEKGSKTLFDHIQKHAKNLHSKIRDKATKK